MVSGIDKSEKASSAFGLHGAGQASTSRRGATAYVPQDRDVRQHILEGGQFLGHTSILASRRVRGPGHLRSTDAYGYGLVHRGGVPATFFLDFRHDRASTFRRANEVDDVWACQSRPHKIARGDLYPRREVFKPVRDIAGGELQCQCDSSTVGVVSYPRDSPW